MSRNNTSEQVEIESGTILLSEACEGGVTLIELLIATSIVVILAIATLSLQYILSENRVVVTKSYLNISAANSSIKSLARELRTAQYSDVGSFPIETASDQELIFFSDINFDGTIERLRYTLTGEELVRGVIEPVGNPASYPVENEKVKTLSSDIINNTQPLFTYYNSDWPEDTVNNPLGNSPNLSDIKLIKIFLEISSDDAGSDSYILENFTNVRVMKDNQ